MEDRSIDRKWIKHLLYIIAIISLLMSINTYFSTDNAFSYIGLIPFSYSALLLLFGKYAEINGPGIITYLIVSFLRYVITPFTIIISQEFCEFYINLEYINSAIIFMIIEMVACFLVIRYYKPASDTDFLYYKASSLSFYVFLVIALAIFASNPNMTGNFNILDEGNISNEDFEGISGALTLVWQASLAFMFSELLLKIHNSNTGFNKLGISLILCLVYLVILFTGQSSISRWYSVVTMSAALAVLLKLYPSKKKTIIVSIVAPSVILILAATIIKNTVVGLNAGSSETISAIFNSNNMDTYFAGPVCVNTAIGAKHSLGVNISSFFYDLLNNFPVLGNSIDRSQASVSLFSKYIMRGDLILPLVAQSYCWFGGIGIPLFSVLSLIMVKKTDLWYSKTSGSISFLIAFLSVWTGLATILNFTIWVSWLYCRVIPAYIVYILSRQRR